MKSSQIEWCKKVLETLKEWGEPMLKTDVILLIDQTNYSYLIGLMDGLAFGGYIRYDFSDADRRLCWVTIGENGLYWLQVDHDLPF